MPAVPRDPLATPAVPVDVTRPSRHHTPRGMVMALREIGDQLGAAVTYNSSDHDLALLSRVSRLACQTAIGHGRTELCFTEVGSWCGESLQAIVAGVRRFRQLDLPEGEPYPVRIDCVDTWLGSPSDNSSVAKQLYGGDVRRWFERARYWAESDSLRIHAVQRDSLAAARQVEAHSRDFVYLDAGHDQQSIQDDIQAWYPKVRPGGILAGHDYHPEMFPDVPQVVDAFCQRLGVAPLVPANSHIWLLWKVSED